MKVIVLLKKNIEKIDLMDIYEPMLSRLLKLRWKNGEYDQSLLENKIGFKIDEFKYALDNVVMYINDYENEEGFVQPKGRNEEFSFDEVTGILWISGIDINFSGAPLEIEFVGMFFPCGIPLKSEKGISRFSMYKDLYVDEKQKKTVKPESFSSYDYKKLYTLKDSVNTKIKKETKMKEDFFVIKSKYINLNKNI